MLFNVGCMFSVSLRWECANPVVASANSRIVNVASIFLFFLGFSFFSVAFVC